MRVQTNFEAQHDQSLSSISMTSVEAALFGVEHAQPLSDAPDPLRQSLLQLPPHHLINTLHHSGHNTEFVYERDPEAWDVVLQYPSGYTERYCLSQHVRPLRGKNAPAATPLEDLLRTVRTLQKHIGCSETMTHNTMMRLQTAWKCRSQLLFQESLDSFNSMITPLTQLSDEIVELFFDQLYDRAVAPHINSLKSGKEENVYGEIRPVFLSRILKQLGVTRRSVYLDLGSGVGNTVMQAALETGCEAHGIEREAFPHLIGAFHLQQFHARAVLWGLFPGQVSLHFGDFLLSQLIAGLLKGVDAVVINNVKFGPDTDARLYELLAKEMKVGAKVFSFRPLKLAGRARMKDRMFEVETCEYGQGSVSWTDSAGTYYISTKQEAGR